MTNLSEIINYKEHPLDNSDYINFCKDEIVDKSILVLNNFLTKECLNELISEALNLENNAFYCVQNHTILLNKYDNSLKDDDPLNIEVKSDKGCVPHDLLNKKSNGFPCFQPLPSKAFPS